MTQSIDSGRLTLILNELRLPAIKQDWAAFAERADKESWPAARFLTMLAEHEVAERDRRRLARHLIEAQSVAWKNPRQLRLRRGADDLEGPCPGALRRRQLDRQRRQSAADRRTRWRKNPSRVRDRPGAGGKWLPRSVRPHLRSGSEAAGRSSRTWPSKPPSTGSTASTC